MMNSKYVFSIFHPEYLVDLLRSGARIPIWQTFSLPSSDTTEDELRDFIIKKFPPLSEERHEIWLRFCVNEENPTLWFSLEDIESAHFYSAHREEAAERGVIHTLNVYGIPVGEPLDANSLHLVEVYSSVVREHTAATIVKAWFPGITISTEFIAQLELGYKYQQSPAPEQLPQIPSKMIWAHMVAYNPGLRKFDERPDVLCLQDIQEVIRRTDADFKQELKSIGDKYSSKFSDLVDDAERTKKSGIGLAKWLLLNRKKENTYLFELDQFLSSLGKQKSFFYSALLYLNWREKVLDIDYNGKLADHNVVSPFLINTSEIDLKQSVAEALFTIVYAGGPRVFQQALIEARKKILHLPEFGTDSIKEKAPTTKGEKAAIKPLWSRIFEDAKKEIGKYFGRLFDKYPEEKKKILSKEVKAISLNKAKIVKGEFDYEQYVIVSTLLGMPVEQFDDAPLNIAIIQEADILNKSIEDVQKNEVKQLDEDANIVEEANPNDVVPIIEIRAGKIDEVPVLETSKDYQFGEASKKDESLATELSNIDAKIKNSKRDKPAKTTKPNKTKKIIRSAGQEINFPSEDVTNDEKNHDNDEVNSS